MSRFGTLDTQFFDDSGDPLVNGLINFYESGTTTRKTTYKDPGLTIPNTNPVVLTAAGRLNYNVYFDGVCDAVVTTSAGAVLANPAGTALGSGSTTPLTDWTSVSFYSAGDFVIGSDGYVYASIINDNQGNDPTASGSESYWQQLVLPTVWNTNVTYAADDVVQGSDGNLYKSLISSNTANNPVGGDGTKWGNPTTSVYNAGDVVFSTDTASYTTPTWLPCARASYNTTTYADLYAVLGDFPVQIANPSTLPTSNSEKLSWSANNTYLAVPISGGSPYVHIYGRSGDVLTKLSNPASLPNGSAYAAEFSPDLGYLAVAHTGAADYQTVYQITAGPTFTKLANPATVPAVGSRDCSWDNTSGYLAFAHIGTPYVSLYSVSGTTMTKQANPASLPGGAGYSCAFTPAGDYLAVGHNGGDNLTLYSHAAGALIKQSTPADLPGSQVDGVAWDPTGTYLAVAGGNAPYLRIYERSAGVLTLVSEPESNLAASAKDVAFSKDGKYLLVGVNSSTTPYYLYAFDSGEISEIRLDSDIARAVYGVAFGDNDDYMAMALNGGTPYMAVFKGSPLLPDISVDDIGKTKAFINTGL